MNPMLRMASAAVLAVMGETGLPLRVARVLTREARRRQNMPRTDGKRECSRRLRQIAAGSLRVENGLVHAG